MKPLKGLNIYIFYTENLVTNGIFTVLKIKHYWRFENRGKTQLDTA